jgi:signal transduction histidine kinase/ligand-binding sensor protein
MLEPEPLTPPHKEHEMLYSKLFAECLPGMRKFLDVLFASIFQKWGAFVVVAIEGEGDYRAVEYSSVVAPFCAAIHDLGLKDRCIECDKRRAHEVALSRKQLSYWCFGGMREFAVPILIHDVTVGVIICGQKRLDGNDDLEGQLILEKFLEKNDIKDLLEELQEKRNLCPAVSPSQVKEMFDILWATSQFISQVLYNKLDETTKSEQASDALKDLFAGFGELDGKRMTPARFWDALNKPLSNLSTMFDSRSIAVVLETCEEYRVLAAHGLGRVKFQAPPEAHLISSTVNDFTVPEYLVLTEQPALDCFLTSLVREIYPTVNSVLFDKAKLGDDRILHILVYFDPTVPHHNRLFLHQKKQILSLFLRETANSFLHTEREEQLRKDLEDRDALLQNVVHQINQPLHGILAYCDNLVSDKFPEDRKTRIVKSLPQQAKQLVMLVKSVQYAGQEGILSTEKHYPYKLNLSKFLIENAKDFQGYAEEKYVRIEVDRTVSDFLGEVLIDRDHFVMALTNVLFNAVKYAFPGTTVTIRSEVANQLLRILVIDDGIEIKPSERESVFDRHKRTGLAKSFSQSGLGIGLFVTRALMRRMGGDAAVIESSPTGGAYKQFFEHRTTIALTLPQSVLLRSGGTN